MSTKVLLSSGAHVNHRLRRTGSTALMVASRHGYVEIASTLLKAGANFTIQHLGSHLDAMAIAKANNQSAIVELLSSHGLRWGRD